MPTPPSQQLLRSSAAAVFFSSLVERVRRIRAHAPIVDFGVKRNIYLTYVTKILTHFTFTMWYQSLKWCQRDPLLEGNLEGLRVRAAGLKLFIVSIYYLACHLCIGCSLPLSNYRTKLCVITDMLVPHSFIGTYTNSGPRKCLCIIALKFCYCSCLPPLQPSMKATTRSTRLYDENLVCAQLALQTTTLLQSE